MELELLKCVLPDKFDARCIVAKLPPSWRNFATSLKHQRNEFSVENIIGSLDVDEKARSKDKQTGGTEGRSAANLVQKNAHKFKEKNKGVSQTTNFKKKARGSSVMTGNGLHATVPALLCRFAYFLNKSDNTMSDINGSHGGAVGATFPVAMYVIFLSYLALLLVPCSDLVHVLRTECKADD
ncbi:hypothetical protein QYE76_037826 [Lolium multiflorum]|uniref:Uncharacterized protein n=1 Tax=Lolium multiflorum TaxID=4521 RepID=A0AAD8T7Q2_LOLMU|nr:hypothetical protein QYE76_037826 [Lolium multiflorum]